MERGKSQHGRGAKGKIAQYPTDLFALGSKNSGVLNRDDAKRSIHKSTAATSERKRDGPSTSIPSSKKPKLSSFGTSPVDYTSTLDIDPPDLVPQILNAYDVHNSEKMIGLLVGAIRLLKSQRWKPDLILCHGLIYLAKIRPVVFGNDAVMQALCNLLKREQGTAFKNKGNPLLFVLGCNLLYAGYKDAKIWPDVFIKVYIEDALNERLWVDCSWCKCFVDNIATAFLTVSPPIHLMPNDNNTLGTLSPSGSPLVSASEEDAETADLEYITYPKYNNSESVEAMVLEAIKEQLGRRAAPDAIGKGFLKLLAATSGFPEIRFIAACRLESWLHSGKLWRPAQELLAYLSTNISSTATRDQEVLAQLVKMRLKTKPLVTAYLNCLREMVSNSPVILHSVVMHTIYNELSSVRNPNSMTVIASLIQAQPQAVPQAMAETFQELLMRPEEYLRPLRALIREAIRAGRSEVTQSLLSLCRALVSAPSKEAPNDNKERMFHAIADLLSLCIMLTAINAKHHSDYKMQIASIQSDGVWWLYENAVSLYRPQQQEYVLALHKIMFLENVDTYSKLDNWPQESERTIAYRTSCEVPLLQNTLIRILCIGLSKELPITPGEALELCEQLVRRASALSTDENPLPVDKIEVADYIFQLCQYHHPENITLPQGYVAPSLAITSLYWRAWMVLVMIAAHNPHTFSRQAFDKYPTLKALIEMCITNKWTCVECVAEIEGERAAVLQFEGHLAAASTKVPITEHTSRLLSQLMLMDPIGPARRPPFSVLECLQALNKSLRLGYLLCRQPALLLDIISRQGTQRAMPWLQDLLHNSEHSLNVLPVQCLCEFLVVGGSSGLGGKTHELIQHLRQLVDGASTVHDVIAFFLQRLTHTHPPIRHQANRGLKLVLSPLDSEEPTEAEWNANVTPEEWLSIISTSRHWNLIRDEVVAALRGACLVETEPTYITCYISFLAEHAHSNCTTALQLQDIVLDLGQLIVERMCIMSAIMPSTLNSNESQNENDALNPHQTLYSLNSIFHLYMQKVRELRIEEYDWCSTQDQILLQWPSGEKCTMHILIVHAIIILLTYGVSKFDENETIFQWFLSVWFGLNAPKAFLIDMSEDAILFPDWLKLKMVRSNQPALIRAGLKDLDAQQLVLFIQSFGIPIDSMSALLSALDTCPPNAFADLVVERGYMAQLVGVQWRRGAHGGQHFYKCLNLQEPIYPEEKVMVEDPLPSLPHFGSFSNEEWKHLYTKTPNDCNELSLEQVSALFAATFVGSSTFEGNISTAFISLQKIIALEIKKIKVELLSVVDCPFIQCIVIYLGLILKGPKCYQFEEGFLKHIKYSCPLMRLLLHCRQSPFEEPLTKVAETLLIHYGDIKNPLIPLLKQFTDKNSKNNETDTCISGEKNICEKVETLPNEKEKIDYIVKTVETCPINMLEKISKSVIELNDTKMVIKAMTMILEKQQDCNFQKFKAEPGVEIYNNQLSLESGGEASGLIIDWLTDLQPELLSENPKQEMHLMFKTNGAPWQELLVALLAHRASWQTLHRCITSLLSSDKKWEATTVLELIWALTRSPRIWQGRDKTTPKHHSQEDILQLSHEQLDILVSYILEEAEKCKISDQACLKIESRMPLLLQCLQNEHAILSLLMNLENKSLESNNTLQMFIILLYMRIPKIWNIIFLNSASSNITFLDSNETDYTECSTSIIDKILHCMFTALAATPHSKDWRQRIQVGLEASCKSLCKQHPRLALRQLGLLGTLLKGRSHLAWSPFNNGGHFTYFSRTIRILETLQPFIFALPYRKNLHMALDSYFAVISMHGHMKDLSSLIQRFGTLLQGYITYDVAAANEYLREHHNIICAHSSLSNLSNGEVTSVQNEVQMAKLDAIDRNLQRTSVDQSPLTVLKNVIAFNVDIDTGLAALMRCLDASNQEFAIDALDMLPELIVCMQEHATQILSKVFELGMRSKIDTENYITKCIATLNAYRGC